jgi:hypothetical protein
MNLKEFIEETVKQIIDGVVESQKHARSKKAVVFPQGAIRKVSFDVSITVVENTELHGKAGLSVWSIGASAGGKSENVNTLAHRIKFDVDIQYPDGSDGSYSLPDHTE